MPVEIIAAMIGAIASILVPFIDVYLSYGKGTKVPTTFWYRRPIFSIPFGIFIGFILFKLGMDLYNKHKLEGIVEKQVNSYSKLVKKGLDEPNKDYIIPSVTVIVRLDEKQIRDVRIRESTEQIIYQIHALKDIAIKDRKGFNEFYHNSTADDVLYIHGSDEEVLTELGHGQKGWNVFFDSLFGQRYTVVTGARFIYPPNIPANRKIHFFTNLTPQQDAFCYPNTDGDVIGDLLIMIETDTLAFYSEQNGLEGGLERGNQIKNVKVNVYAEKPGSPLHRVSVARFGALENKETACLKVNWSSN
jgi:hypothetical protein